MSRSIDTRHSHYETVGGVVQGTEPQIIDQDLSSLYLNLMKRSLTRVLFLERYAPFTPNSRRGRAFAAATGPLLASRDMVLVKRASVDGTVRAAGRDWPTEAETMIGLRRLDNIEHCIRSVVSDRVPGDLIETGVWRGGAAIFMRAALAAFGDTSRKVWLADSFAGLPPPDPSNPVDEGDLHHTQSELIVSLEEVQENFRRYELLDDRVQFLKGWFKDTLPHAPIDRLAVMRLDGDMYGSTMDALSALYERLSPGGFVIVDDYALAGAREAVTDFRRENAIDDPIESIDFTGVFWRRKG